MTTSSANQDADPDEQLTQLVSYLDGELAPEQLDEFEMHLVNDPKMRSDVDVLSRTWALLDGLEEDVPQSHSFTQETLVAIAAETVEDETPASEKPRSPLLETLAGLHVLPCFLIGIVAAAIGLFVSGRAASRQAALPAAQVEKLLLENIDMLPQRELYGQVPSADVLKSLDLSGEDQDSPPIDPQDAP